MIYCLFEQSGTFKNEFIKLGFSAKDFDIKNDFGVTDEIKDLFEEIDLAFKGKKSMFDEITTDDLIFAFFPCTRFSARVPLLMRGESSQQKNWDNEKKLIYSIKIQNQLNYLYSMLSELVIICIRKELKLIIENPYTQPHYLTERWCIKPSIIDKDRTIRGDNFKKPTQYFFINTEPKHNFIMEPITDKPVYTISHAEKMPGKQSREVKRSLITQEYANRFIREFIL